MHIRRDIVETVLNQLQNEIIDLTGTQFKKAT
jgi:hypothetical protein